MSRFQKATRKQARARIGLAGPSGSGKTIASLITATVMAGGEVAFDGVRYHAGQKVEYDGKTKTYDVTPFPDGQRIAFIDTEKGSASLYSDQFDFDVEEFEAPYSPDRLAASITDAAAAGYAAVVVDGLSPFWNGPGGVLEIVERAGKRMGGNSYAGWAEGTPAQNRLIAAILDAPLHIIVTMRSKQDHVQEKDDRGRTVVRKVGMSPIQRDGMEYELTIAADLDIAHNLNVTKSRCPDVADRFFEPGEVKDFATLVRAWLGQGDLGPDLRPLTDEQAAEIDAYRAALGLTVDQLNSVLLKDFKSNLAGLTEARAQEVLDRMKAKADAKAEADAKKGKVKPAGDADPFSDTPVAENEEVWA